jgi:hypothetical protein
MAEAVIVCTSEWTREQSKSGDVVSRAKEYSMPVHVVAVRPGRESRRLERLARLTGGSYVLCCNDDAIRTLYGILKIGGTSRYDVRYRSMTSADGLARPVEVRLRYDSLRDRDSLDIVYPRRAVIPGLANVPQLLLVALILIIVVYWRVASILLLRKGTIAIRAGRDRTGRFAPASRTRTSLGSFKRRSVGTRMPGVIETG